MYERIKMKRKSLKQRRIAIKFEFKIKENLLHGRAFETNNIGVLLVCECSFKSAGVVG